MPGEAGSTVYTKECRRPNLLGIARRFGNISPFPAHDGSWAFPSKKNGGALNANRRLQFFLKMDRNMIRSVVCHYFSVNVPKRDVFSHESFSGWLHFATETRSPLPSSLLTCSSMPN